MSLADILANKATNSGMTSKNNTAMESAGKQRARARNQSSGNSIIKPIDLCSSDDDTDNEDQHRPFSIKHENRERPEVSQTHIKKDPESHTEQHPLAALQNMAAVSSTTAATSHSAAVAVQKTKSRITTSDTSTTNAEKRRANDQPNSAPPTKKTKPSRGAEADDVDANEERIRNRIGSQRSNVMEKTITALRQMRNGHSPKQFVPKGPEWEDNRPLIDVCNCLAEIGDNLPSRRIVGKMPLPGVLSWPKKTDEWSNNDMERVKQVLRNNAAGYLDQLKKFYPDFKPLRKATQQGSGVSTPLVDPQEKASHSQQAVQLPVANGIPVKAIEIDKNTALDPTQNLQVSQKSETTDEVEELRKFTNANLRLFQEWKKETDKQETQKKLAALEAEQEKLKAHLAGLEAGSEESSQTSQGGGNGTAM